jgi:hypothetical protein
MALTRKEWWPCAPERVFIGGRKRRSALENRATKAKGNATKTDVTATKTQSPPMPHDFIPKSDGEFNVWLREFNAKVFAFYNAHGLDTDSLLPLQSAVAGWTTVYPAHIAAQAAARAATQTKDASRARIESLARPIAAYVQALPITTNADRATMGLTLRGRARVKGGGPTTAPIALVKEGGRLTHELRLVDSATPTRRARPKGIARAEVFVALAPPLSPPPNNLDEYRYVGSVTDGTTTLTFKIDQGGLQAHYIARWISTSGETGGWSETASATVAA